MPQKESLSPKTGDSLQTSLIYGITGGGILGIIETLIAWPIYQWRLPNLTQITEGPAIYMAIGAIWGIICHILLFILDSFQVYGNLPTEADCLCGAADIAFAISAWVAVWSRRIFLAEAGMAIIIPYMVGLAAIACILAWLLYKFLKRQKGKDRLFASYGALSVALYSLTAMGLCLNTMPFRDFIPSWPPDMKSDTKTANSPTVTAPNRPNIILITPDTLRSDHLSCYGYTRIKTPAIDSLAAGGVLFKKTISAAPWTLPSFTSLLSSLYPSAHGAGRGQNMENIKMADQVMLLPQILKMAGYYTKAIVNIPMLNGLFGFSRGFDDYQNRLSRYQIAVDKLKTEKPGRRAAPLLWASTWGINLKSKIPSRTNLATTEDAIQWLDQNQRYPFFFWIHYYGLHFPYERCKSYNLDPEYHGKLAQIPPGAFMKRDDLNTGRYKTTQADRNHLRSMYDEELLFIDEGIGRILDKLRQLKLMDNTLIIFASDHGEEFWDHGRFEHGHTLYRELLEVPLIMKWPGVLPAGRTVTDQVRLIDVTPTIIELLGIKYSGDSPIKSVGEKFTGQSLLPLIKGEGRGDRVAFSENLYYYEEQKAITTGRYKLIYTPDSGDTKLYDLEADPEEKVDIAAERASETSQLREELQDWLKDCQAKAAVLNKGKASTPVRDEELMQQLKSLGYF